MKIYFLSHQNHTNNHEINFPMPLAFIFWLILLGLFSLFLKMCINCRKRCKTIDIQKFNSDYEGINEECPICLEAIDNNTITIRCQHSFHTKCLEQWVKTPIEENGNNFNCPLCNENYLLNA